MDKTGNTQGIRFKITPPINANRHASHSDTPGKVGTPDGGGVTARRATLSTATSNARRFPFSSRTTKMPDKESTFPFGSLPWAWITRGPGPVARNVCAAEWTMTSLRSGKN